MTISAWGSSKLRGFIQINKRLDNNMVRQALPYDKLKK